MEKKISIVFISLILALCLLPSVGMLLAPKTEGGDALPSLLDGKGRFETDYFSQLACFVENNHFPRQRMATAWSALNEELLNASTAENVVLGRDGWLYFGDTLDDYTGAEILSQREIFSAAHNLRLMASYCERQGADFLFTIAPNKNSLYPQYMPPMTRHSQSANAKALAAALKEEGVAYLDLFALFEDQSEPLYFTKDSHWNSRGAALAADGLNAAFGRTSDYFSGPFQSQSIHRSDLYAMLRPAGTWLEEDQVYGGALRFTYDVPIRSAESITIMTTGEAGEGSLLLFRDSFGNALYPYLADSFEKALFSRAADYRLDLIAQRQADFVVVELVERNIAYLTQNSPVMPAPQSGAGKVDFREQSEAAMKVEPVEELPGYVRLSGTLPDKPVENSHAYLSVGENWYEAFLVGEDGFTLCVPENILTEERSLVFTAGEGVTSFPASIR